MEFELSPFAIAAIVAMYCIVIPVSMILPKKKRKNQIQIEPITEEFRQNKRDFIFVGIPFGIFLGILGHLEDIIPSSWFSEEAYKLVVFYFKITAIFPTATIVSILVVFTGMITIKYVLNKNIKIPKKEMTEGMFASIFL